VTTAAALRAWATSAATAREFRALLADAPPSPAVVVLVGATIPPETIPRDRWRTVGPHRAAVVDLALARSLAAGRSPSAARAMRAPSSPRFVPCIALGAGGASVTWEHVARGAHHEPPPKPPPVFGERGPQRTLPWGDA